MVRHIEKMLAQFELDPADTDYKRGYRACVIELLRIARLEEEVFDFHEGEELFTEKN